jgi:hypothetical protein
MVDTTPVTATDEMRRVANSIGGGDGKVTAEATKGALTPNEAAPRSDTPQTPDAGTAPASESAAPTPDPAATDAKAPVADPNELKPNVDPDPNALPPLQQTNQLDSSNGTSSAATSAAAAKTEEMADISSSKKKKKKGVAKLNPF